MTLLPARIGCRPVTSAPQRNTSIGAPSMNLLCFGVRNSPREPTRVAGSGGHRPSAVVCAVPLGLGAGDPEGRRDVQAVVRRSAGCPRAGITSQATIPWFDANGFQFPGISSCRGVVAALSTPKRSGTCDRMLGLCESGGEPCTALRGPQGPHRRRGCTRCSVFACNGHAEFDTGAGLLYCAPCVGGVTPPHRRGPGPGDHPPSDRPPGPNVPLRGRVLLAVGRANQLLRPS